MAKRYVTNDDTSVRMFRSDFLEMFTRVHPMVPHVIFLPVVGYAVYVSLQHGVATALTVALFAAGLAAWSFTEYTMHRFVFHVSPRVEQDVHHVVQQLEPDQPAIPVLDGWNHLRYFIAHGVHHDFPNDSTRLVMPPSVSIPLAVVFYLLFDAVFGAAYTPALFGGFVLGYLVYDTTHYAVHHLRVRTRIGRYLKKHHFRHHYLDSTRDFGVSSPVWDVVLGTLGSRTATHTPHTHTDE